jgi:error-prone DNA polymerase
VDEQTGAVSVNAWKWVRQCDELPHSRLLALYGVWQREGDVRHLFARWLTHLTPLLGWLAKNSQDFKLRLPTYVPPPALGPFLNSFVED